MAREKDRGLVRSDPKMIPLGEVGRAMLIERAWKRLRRL